jgi:hypothetical protein
LIRIIYTGANGAGKRSWLEKKPGAFRTGGTIAEPLLSAIAESRDLREAVQGRRGKR